MLRLDLNKLRQAVAAPALLRPVGRLRGATGLLLSCSVTAAVGDQCEIHAPGGQRVLAEVIGFSQGTAYLVPFEKGAEIRPGLDVVRREQGLLVPVGDALLGRSLDGLGRPIDGGPSLDGCPQRPVRYDAPAPLARARIRQPLVTGVRVLDGLLTLGRGQRVGIFAGSGVGKSTLLGEIAKGSDADVNVIALIGERGREVQPFLDDCVGEEGMKKSVVLVATCEQTPLMRVRAAQVAITMADFYRSQGAKVLLMMDSLTRLAMAQRELGLALGEPPTSRGYPPSSFQLLANTIEALGNGAEGSITGILTVLVDGGDMDEPIADAVRGLVDGHVVLDRKLAEKGHYPAVSVGQSISRVAGDITDKGHQVAARKLRAMLATYAEVEDLIRIGEYAKGSSPAVDRAVELRPALLQFLRQEVNERTRFEDTRKALDQLAAAWPFC